MFSVWKDMVISSAHNLRDYKGRCENLHGHNWTVRVVVAGDTLDATGMLLDFSDLDRAMQAVIAPYDHIYFNETPPFDSLNPSAENIAKFFFDRLAERLDCARYAVWEVRVWESGPCCATYRRAETRTNKGG